MEKVKVSKEVAEAIEELRKRCESDEEILRVLANPSGRWVMPTTMILNDTPFMMVVKAIVIGYEIEKTPEEIIKEKYDELFDYEPIDRACKDSFRFVLDTLGIKIEGVNA